MKAVRIRYCKVWDYYPRAARVAALIEKETGAKPEVIEGSRGEFTVWVGDKRVSQKTSDGFPTDQEALSAVRQALWRKGRR